MSTVLKIPSLPVMETHNASSTDVARLSFDRRSSEAILGAENDNAVHPAMFTSNHEEIPSNHNPQPPNSNDATEKASPKPRAVHMWNPFCLRKITLLAFTVLFAMMFVAVLLLYHFSELHHGLSTQTPHNHYSWTYGPTAFLVIVVALWNQVDYACKLLTPWQEMRRGPSVASKTLLLDYISPWILSVMLMAFKNGHWAVVASSVGFALLKLTVVFSTGLLILESTAMTEANQPFVITTKFDANNFSYLSVVQEPIQTYYGVHERSLPYPNGTSSSDLAVQLFNPLRKTPSNSKITANVHGFAPSLECQVAETTVPVEAYVPWSTSNTSRFFTNAFTPDCKILNATVATGAFRGHRNAKNATQAYQGSYETYSCNDGIDNSLRGYQTSEASDARFLITMADLRWNTQKGNEDITNSRVEDLTAVLCKPSYSLNEYRVSFTDSPTGSSLLMEATKTSAGVSQLPGLENPDLVASILEAAKYTTLGLGGEDAVLYEVDPFFQLMAFTNNHSRQKAFMDAEVLQDSACAVFRGLAVQIAHQYLMSPQNETILGTVEYTEDRLKVKRLSVSLMAITLGLLVFISISELFICPRDVAPRKPDSISAVSVILSNSKKLKDCLSMLGSARLSSIRHHVSTRLFRTTTTDNHFCIEPMTYLFEKPMQPPLKNDASQLKWWRSVAVKLPMRLLTVSIPVVGILVLEILQRLSDQRNGFINIAHKHGDTAVFITYIPAIAMLLIATLYTALESTVATYAPYNALWHGDSPARRSIMVNVQGRMPPQALSLSLKSRYSAVSFTVLATFMASVLSIIVSALYTLVNIPSIQTLAVRQMDTFNFSQGSLSLDDNQAGTITSLIVHQNLSNPPWTHEDLVFPTLASPTLGDFFAANNTTAETVAVSITVVLPAIRASLNCSAVPSNAITVTAAEAYTGRFDNTSYPYSALVTFNATLPWVCRDNPGNISETHWPMNLTTSLNSTGVLSGAATVLSWGVDVEDSDVMGPGPQWTADAFGTGGMGCPSFGFTLATIDASKTTDSQNASIVTYSVKDTVTMVTCYQLLQEVMTKTTLLLPSLALDPAHVPAPLEHTAHYLHNDSNGQNWEFPVNTFLLSLATPENNPTNELDAFMQAIIYGKDGIPGTELVGPAGLPKLIDASNKLYSTYMAQAISANMRNSTAPNGQALPNYQANLTDPYKQRLQQNKGPKIALQVLLGLMAFCAIMAYVLMETNTVLPHNPCSIAGMATLLAGSELCTRRVIPEDADRMSERELQKAGIFDGWVFSMGWWGEEVAGSTLPGKGRRFGIDVGRADKAS